jgi:hypothetical protein
MPYTLRKLPGIPRWKVFNKKTGRVFAKRTTYDKATRQLRLLRGIERKEN